MFFCRKSKYFPDANTAKTLFNGVPYDEIEICNIKATPNNTLINITNTKGMYLLIYNQAINNIEYYFKLLHALLNKSININYNS